VLGKLVRTRVLLPFENPQNIVIPKRGIVTRGICCFAAGRKRISSPMNPASE